MSASSDRSFVLRHFLSSAAGLDFFPLSVMRLERSDVPKSLTSQILHLADCAGSIIDGLYRTPITTEMIVLPWAPEAGVSRDDIAAERARVMARLSSLLYWGYTDFLEDHIPTTYFRADILTTTNDTLQGLAVEVLLALDQCVEHLIANQLMRAMQFLAAAYVDFAEAGMLVAELMMARQPRRKSQRTKPAGERCRD